MAEDPEKAEQQDDKAASTPKSRKKGRGWKIALWIIASPILLFIVLALLLYLPPVQKFAVNVIGNKLAESSGMSIHVDDIHLKFPLTLSVGGLTAIQGPDTLIMSETADLDISLKPLFDNKIELNRLRFSNARINTDGLIAEANVKGDIGELDIKARNIDLKKEIAQVDHTKFTDAALTVTIPDSVPIDTTEALRWKAYLENITFNNSSIRLKLAPQADSVVVNTYFEATTLKGSLDLYTSDFLFHDLNFKNSRVNYDVGNSQRAEGFDPAHIGLTDLNGRIDSVTYRGTGDLVVAFDGLSTKEASGIQVDTLTGQFRMDTLGIHTHQLRMLTTDSDLRIDADMDFDAFAEGSDGRFQAKVRGTIGKDDITTLSPTLPADIKKAYPPVPMRLDADIEGNADTLTINRLTASMDGKFSLSTRGAIQSYLNPESERFSIDMEEVDAKVHDPKFVSSFMPADVSSMVKVPANAHITTSFGMKGTKMNAKGKLKDQNGTTTYDISYDTTDDSYDADITANNLVVNNYVALDESCHLTGHIRAKGKGTDFLSPRTVADISAQIEKGNYGQIDASNSNLTAKVANGELMAQLNCNNPQLLTSLRLTSDITKDNLNARGRIHLQRSDLQAMGLSEEKLNIMAISDFNFNTDMKKAHSFEGRADSIFIVMGSDTISSGEIYLDGWTDRDTTNAVVSTNGVDMHFRSSVNALELGEKYMKVAGILGKQIEKRDLDINYAKQFLPTSDILLSLNNDNAVAQFLKIQGIKYDDIQGHFSTSPEAGLQGNAHISNLKVKKDSVVIDNIDLKIQQDSTRLTYDLSLATGEHFHHPGFSGALKGYFENFSADTRLTFYNDKGRTGLDLGIHALATDTAGYFRFYPEEPILGFRKFKVNTDNYLLLKKKNKAYADIHLSSDNGTRIDFTANPDAQTEQDFNLSIENFGIKQLLSILPMAPDMDGQLNIKANYRQENGNTSVVGDIKANDFVFGGTKLGDVGATLNYIPDGTDRHSIDGSISQDTIHVANYSGFYSDNGQFSLNADLNQLPLEMSAPFLPDKQIVALNGYIGGHLSVEGTTEKFLVNGELKPSGMVAMSQMYGVKLRFEDKPITIENSKLSFEQFNVYGYDDTPLSLTGSVDFSDFDNLRFSLGAYGRNFALVDTPRSSKSVLFGKVNADLFARIVGEPNNVSIRGLINVLDNTDMTYLIKDTPLTVEDRLSDLVTFVNFSAPPPEDIESLKKTIMGIDMRLNLNIKEGSRLRSEFSSDRQSYINLDGEGQILMIYTPEGVFQLQGRYTLNNGEMKYELPIIPLKTFTIQNGSYVEFTGAPMNPTLNITATERTKAAVSDANGGSRSVTFDVGMKISNTLQDMGLVFTIEAPEDMSVQNELASMSAEDKNKLAVAMLATGMYLSGSNSTGFSSSNALNNFLQNEINNIAGDAFSSVVDINVGIEQSQNNRGQTHTDYSFKFSKRFFSDRLSVVIGGKVSADNNSDYQRSGTYIDDVSLEWRLNKGSSRYIRLYHDRNFDNLIEGELIENGAGFILRKRVDHLSELLIFKSKKEEQSAPPLRRPGAATPADSTSSATPGGNNRRQEEPASPPENEEKTDSTTNTNRNSEKQ
ncbi:MAG: translocation/assembly module TamB domain-containing protein [Bacteroidaceae bacterium]|nr:translocation/assembly module TamB domain-containing protein [Bacteroidaceae bacterium]